MIAQGTQLDAWRSALTSARSRVTALVLPLTPTERSRPPGGGAWTVDQVLEHLTISNALYAERMKAAIASHAQRAPADAGEWTPTWIGRFLRNAVDPSAARKLRSPKRSRPGPTVSPGVLERFVAGLDELAALAAQAERADLRRVRFTSPLSKLVRINLGDGFAICVAHVARHANQIARTIAANRAAA